MPTCNRWMSCADDPSRQSHATRTRLRSAVSAHSERLAAKPIIVGYAVCVTKLAGSTIAPTSALTSAVLPLLNSPITATRRGFRTEPVRRTGVAPHPAAGAPSPDGGSRYTTSLIPPRSHPAHHPVVRAPLAAPRASPCRPSAALHRHRLAAVGLPRRAEDPPRLPHHRAEPARLPGGPRAVPHRCADRC